MFCREPLGTSSSVQFSEAKHNKCKKNEHRRKRSTRRKKYYINFRLRSNWAGSCETGGSWRKVRFSKKSKISTQHVRFFLLMEFVVNHPHEFVSRNLGSRPPCHKGKKTTSTKVEVWKSKILDDQCGEAESHKSYLRGLMNLRTP